MNMKLQAILKAFFPDQQSNNRDHSTGSNATEPIAKEYVTDKCILIRINQTYSSNMTEDQIYEVTRKSWVLDPYRANDAHYVMAINHGICVGVYLIFEWKFTKEMNNRRRYEFIGEPAEPAIMDKYYSQNFESFWSRGAANPITYVNC